MHIERLFTRFATGGLIFACLAFSESAAGQERRYAYNEPIALQGYVEPASKPYNTYSDYVVRKSKHGGVFVGLKETSETLSAASGTWIRVTGYMTQLTETNHVPVLTLSRLLPVSPIRSSVDAIHFGTVSGYGHWSGHSLNGDYPAVGSVHPPMGDSDRDAVPDSDDTLVWVASVLTDVDSDGCPDPLDPDDDNDGMTDIYEVQNGLDPEYADALSDLDSDGQNNIAEYIAGTLANNASSRFEIVSMRRLTNQWIELKWISATDRQYTLYGWNSLINTSGTPLATFPSLGSGTSKGSFQVNTNENVKFYKLGVELNP